jgi:ABC-type nitrate/sulfonate/bicarbonate transport system substrate-binding protein
MPGWKKIFALFVLGCFGGAPAHAADRIRIGVTNNNLTYLSAGVALKRGFFKLEGLDPEIIRMTPNVSVIALTNGDVDYSMLFGLVDVIVIAPPADTEMRKAGFSLVARIDEVFKFPYVGLGANVKKIKERPDEVKRTIKAMIKANRYIRENRDGAIQVLSEWGGTKLEYAAATYDSSWKFFNPDGSISEDGLRLVVEQAKIEAKIPREISLSEVSDVTALRQAQIELGIRP